jgi:hypothetical protein
MLCELKQQFDVVSPARSWEGYRLLVLPDAVLLDDGAADKVRGHLARGGAVLSTGWSGASPEKKGFVLSDWGLRLEGEDPFDPAYLLAGPGLSAGMPEMPIALYDRGTAVVPLAGTEVWAEIMAPYFSRHWDGEHGFVYLPPDQAAGRAAVTLHGRVAHVSHPIFTSYFNHGQVPLRQMAAHLLARLLPEPMVKAKGLPSFARVTVTRQPGRRMVHLLSYVPEHRGASIDMIEETIDLREVAVALRTEGAQPSRVYLAPSGQGLPFESANGYTHTTVPVVPGYAMIVFEE